MSEDILLVLSICDGRHLPAPPGYSLLAEAKFDHQILQSDPVPLASHVDFNSELAWETDRRALQQHRLHKNPVKVEFYATSDATTDLRQLLGYVVLDTRTAIERQTGAEPEVKWHRILGCRPKSAHELPAVQLGLSLEPNPTGGSSVLDPTIDLSETAGSEPEPCEPSDPQPEPVVPVLDERLGCFQLGPPAGPQELFTLTVIVVHARNLELLIPPEVDLPTGTGFSFYYSLLGCDIVTDTFNNIVQPRFLAERAVTRVRARLPVLRRYLQQLGSIDVHLCCGDLSLGSASVPLAPAS
ncbi:centrosomal protein of 120 kDa-like [Pollicipes pollicipes]|uniref:centrosomal protein of 120 kDa-like n=1 Tax=Pollicipes pollicipes TaxID=41117 RepID=UPI001884B663|nr:centrosomal protein of 120 kDa-like [Pollicipes pollicipes]